MSISLKVIKFLQTNLIFQTTVNQHDSGKRGHKLGFRHQFIVDKGLGFQHEKL